MTANSRSRSEGALDIGFQSTAVSTQHIGGRRFDLNQLPAVCAKSPSTQHRTFAEECRRLAKSAKTVEERKVLWERQAIWTKLAAEEADEKSS
jgi:hypothetical protein